jgi:hypothetical protein
MFARSRSTVFALSLCFTLIAAPWLSARAEDDPYAPVPLRTGGRILSKKDEQSIGKNCSAYREWVEVDGLPNAKAESLINSSIRRELTVGKKLTAKDCSEEGRAQYINGATLSAARDKAIGVELSVYFGGEGTGREVTDCAVFDLATGRRHNLRSFLTPAGKALVAQKYCDAFLHEHNTDETEQTSKSCAGYNAFETSLNTGLRYCLGDRGVWARFGPANPVEGRWILISDREIEASFKLPAGLDLANRKP